jgi:hypothetical protein
VDLLGDMVHVESRSVLLEVVLELVQDRRIVCAKHAIQEIVLDAPDRTTR